MHVLNLVGFKPVYRYSGYRKSSFSHIELMKTSDYFLLAQQHTKKASETDLDKHPILGALKFGYHTFRAIRNAKRAVKTEPRSEGVKSLIFSAFGAKMLENLKLATRDI